MTARQDPTPREWLGDLPFPWPPAHSHADLDDIVACYAIHSLTLARTRNDAPFLRMHLTDCYGTVEARMWDGVENVMDLLRPGMYVGVRGRLERYQAERQLRVEEVVPLRVELDDLVLFLPRSARAAEHMDAELAAAIASIREDGLRTLLETLLGVDTDTGHAFRLAPAAKQNHHAYLGGLLEHTLSVVRVCDLLSGHYAPAVDRDLLIAGALLHDLGKVREIGARAGFPYTDEGKLLGHILIGLQMVSDAASAVPSLHPSRLLLLQHLIASHQGRYEWQSPREPRTLEGIVLHYADDLDAKLNQAGSLVDAVPAGWTAYDRNFGRDFLKHHNLDSSASSPAAPPDSASGDAPSPPSNRSSTDAAMAPPAPAGSAVQTSDRPAEADPPGGNAALYTLDLFESE
ncbi:MAG TPA: HD domain-containing protein [Longimicrobiales bacterium]|nr:HD domain-containing protein [Longimicrobiales bacterium]